MSKIVVLCGSMRKKGNTNLLVQAFKEGAQKKNEVTVISVAGKKIYPCDGCNACYKKEKPGCPHKDDMDLIYDSLKEADTLVIASPVYFYGLSARLKAIIDRLHNPVRNELHIKRLGLILVGADDIPPLFDSIIVQYRLVLDYFHLKDIGKVLVRNAEDIGDVKKTTGLLEAFALGASLK